MLLINTVTSLSQLLLFVQVKLKDILCLVHAPSTPVLNLHTCTVHVPVEQSKDSFHTGSDMQAVIIQFYLNDIKKSSLPNAIFIFKEGMIRKCSSNIPFNHPFTG